MPTLWDQEHVPGTCCSREKPPKKSLGTCCSRKHYNHPCFKYPPLTVGRRKFFFPRGVIRTTSCFGGPLIWDFSGCFSFFRRLRRPILCFRRLRRLFNLRLSSFFFTHSWGWYFLRRLERVHILLFPTLLFLLCKLFLHFLNFPHHIPQ